MTQPQDPEYAPLPPANAVPPIPTGPLRPPRRSCGSQILGLIGWLLTLALSVLLALAAAAALLYFVFGLNLATPGELRQASADVAAVRGQAEALQTEVALLRTAEAERAGELAGARERIDELERQAGELAAQTDDLAGQASAVAALGQELDENIALAATIQAEGREDQVLVAVVATLQADNAQRLDDIQARTDRLVRFLQRLGDITGDATLDETPATGTPTAEPSSTLQPTPTAARTPATTATPTATP